MQQKQMELLQALYEEYWEVLHIAASGYGMSQTEADDAVQDTFCSFMEMYLDSAEEWNSRQTGAVLRKILRNRCVDYFRSRNRHPQISIQEFLQGDERRLAGGAFGGDIAGALEVQEDMTRLWEGILSMSLALQSVMVLHMLEERPIEEVSRILNVSEAACRMRIVRIRRFLSDWMENAETADA